MYQSDRAVGKFQEYLRIESKQPDVNYDKCIAFLESYAKELGIDFTKLIVGDDKPMVVITWRGTQPHLPAIMFNSHMDVVAVEEDKWTHRPFNADIVDGVIYARGSQDCKCIGIQYLEAIRRMRENGIRLARTICVTFASDEEVGGEGMRNFVRHEYFEAMNVGFALDEGGYSPDNGRLTIYYAERHRLCVRFRCNGDACHACVISPNTAPEKVTKLLAKIYAYRDGERAKVQRFNDLGEVTTVNVTTINGGVLTNVVPGTIDLVLDARITPTTRVDEYLDMLHAWCEDVGGDIDIEVLERNDLDIPTELSGNVYVDAVRAAAKQLGYNLDMTVCPGSTDARYLRHAKIPALNFSPLIKTPVLLHAHDECLGVDIFLKGIDIYCEMMKRLGNV